MATIKSSSVALMESLGLWLGLFVLVFLLLACQSAIETTPDKVTEAFWQAVIAGDLQSAQNYVTKDSQPTLAADQARKFIAVQVGAMTLDGDNATVVTQLTQNDKKYAFNTTLIKQNEAWKVDYQQTRINISMIPFQSIVNELQNIGETFGEQLEQQVPLIEKSLESFGAQLKQQLEEFNKAMEKPRPAQKTN